MTQFGKVFLHFFDIHFLEEKCVSSIGLPAIKEAKLATRICLLCCDQIIIPASSYFESEICKEIIKEHEDLIALGLIIFVGNARNSLEFIQNKISQYSGAIFQKELYEKALDNELVIPFRPRTRSATRDIKLAWQRILHKSQIPGLFRDCRGVSIPRNIEEKWNQTPYLLEKDAFIVDNVMPIIFPHSENIAIRNRLHGIINQAYFQSYVSDLDACIVSDLVYLESDYLTNSPERCIPYRYIAAEITKRGKYEWVLNAPTEEFLLHSDETEWQEIINISLKKKQAKDLSRISYFQREPTNQMNINVLIQEVIMGDKYIAGQVGAQGPESTAHDMTFNQIWAQTSNDFDLNALANELGILREHLKQEATGPEHDIAIGAVANAEIEAKKGNGPKTLEWLSKAGHWALEKGAAIGVAVASEAIKKSIV